MTLVALCAAHARLGQEAGVLMQSFWRDESGQATVIMLIAIVFLMGAAAFSVEGIRIFAERRSAQNAADAAALAGALAICNGQDAVPPASRRAADNGFQPGAMTEVEIYRPPVDGPSAGNPDYVEVRIVSRIPTSLLGLVYMGPLETTAMAVGHCHFQRAGAQAALFAGSNSCQNSLQWTASQSRIRGNVHSNHDLHIAGGSNWVEGSATYVSSLDTPPDKVTFVPGPPANPTMITFQPYPVSYLAADYAPGGTRASLAEAGGEYVSCNCDLDIQWLEDHGYYDPSTNRIRRGLYYASGRIHLAGNGLIGEGVTFVAREGIRLSNSNHRVSPYLDGLLLFTDQRLPGGAQCNSPVIQLSGSFHQWSGLIYAPGGAIHLSGAEDVGIRGSLIGHTITMAGSTIDIEHEPAYLPPPPPKVQLAQ
jgi:hypothetical protein